MRRKPDYLGRNLYPTAGLYAAVDPGHGPDDQRVLIYTQDREGGITVHGRGEGPQAGRQALDACDEDTRARIRAANALHRARHP